jgi:hypothetical protein
VNVDLRFLLGVAAATVLGLAGCPADDSGDSGADGSTGSDATESSPTGGMTAASNSASGVSMSTDPSASTTPSTSDGTTTMTTSVTDGMTTTGVDPLPNGEVCMSNEECESGMCFLAGILGGICSSCLTDEDCKWGCGLPNPLSQPPQGAECTMGQLGEGCMSEEACMNPDHFCALIIDVPGVLSASTCSECVTTDDCMPGLVCNTSVMIQDIAGQKTCVEPESVPDGEFCDLEGDGDMACTNFCASANIMMLVEFGVCGPCSNANMPNEGCMGGETCIDPTVELDGTVTPSMCM